MNIFRAKQLKRREKSFFQPILFHSHFLSISHINYSFKNEFSAINTNPLNNCCPFETGQSILFTMLEMGLAYSMHIDINSNLPNHRNNGDLKIEARCLAPISRFCSTLGNMKRETIFKRKTKDIVANPQFKAKIQRRKKLL